ncbi:hypothetical protein FIBSPDRAFT_1045163 [Athelia psychrophila]|uniref:RlpA-like protein double-psi beta-barrel domain-containing protein n=1 Tax=Athelia psychrophila TaxID=1759441 RepID=A0A166HGB2_9AGAM|nr:hypothetical protein FIBSPDRAFT_1045946 [Fibularhizoctonia sp. CBS 109695]KZP20111.1 hypothetical protein FIBSPDRAFT_1045163 [Fibularhizoctonia sp. CBS 109695]
MLFRLLLALSLFFMTVTATDTVDAVIGDLFYFTPGLGACGFTNTSSQYVATVSRTFFDSFPGGGTNPNKNPICKHKVEITAGAVSVVAQVVDYCLTCGVTDVGLPKFAFKIFGNSTQGIVPNVSWKVV